MLKKTQCICCVRSVLCPAQLMLSEDRVHELTGELSASKSSQQSAEMRAAALLDQVAKQKHAIHEAGLAAQQDKERQIRAMRIIQMLSKKSVPETPGRNSRAVVCALPRG